MTQREISITELLAICVRKGRKVLAAALLFAVLLGAYQYYVQQREVQETAKKLFGVETLDGIPDWREQAKQRLNADYVVERENYEETKKNYDLQLENYQNKIVYQREYINNSLAMRIDPYNEYITRVYFDVSKVDGSAFDQTFGMTVTPIDYLTDKITGQYTAAWGRAQLPKALGLAEYADLEDKYLRELVSVSVDAGGIVTVTAIGNSMTETEELAKAGYDYLLGQKREVEAVSYRHDVALLSSDTWQRIDDSLIKKQEAAYETLETYKDKIEELDRESKSLSVPSSPRSTSIKTLLLYVLLGAVIGALLVSVWEIAKSLSSGRIETSYQIEREKLPFLGAMPHKRSLFDKLANRLTGERTWKSAETAAQYIAEKTKLRIGEQDNILLLSTLPMPPESAEEARAAIAAGTGGQVVFENDLIHNPKALEALRNCGGVVLAEQCGRSRMEAIAEAIALAGSAGKSVNGFVLI